MLSVFGSSVVILATVAGAIALLFVLRSFWGSELRRVHNDVIGWHVSVIGSTYAVIVGFMLFAVWSNFETAENIAEAEANCLVNVVRSSRGLAPSSHEQIRRLALQYANVMPFGGMARHAAGPSEPCVSCTHSAALDGGNRQPD